MTVSAAASRAPLGRVAAATAIDLFSGAGGGTVGLKNAGLEVLAAVEWDADACATYLLNHPEVHLLQDDIRDVVAADLRKSLGLDRGQLTVLKACPPCPSWSTLGGAKDGDDRPELIREVWQFVRAFAPQVVMLENVPGLAREVRLHRLLRQLRGAGYRIRYEVLDAAAFGIPQRRKRLIVLAVRNGKRPPPLAELVTDQAARACGAIIRSAGPLDPTDPLHRARNLRSLTLERIRAIPQRGGHSDLPVRLRLACHVRLSEGGRPSDASQPYGRIDPDLPAPTMTTRCTTPSCGRFLHPDEDRPITLREASLLQGFPPRYNFSGGYCSVEQQIGNALPPAMAERVVGLALDLPTMADQAAPSLALLSCT